MQAVAYLAFAAFVLVALVAFVCDEWNRDEWNEQSATGESFLLVDTWGDEQ